VDGTLAELGAEFVHGRSEQMLNVLRQAKLELMDASECNRVVKNRGLKKVDLWKRVGEVIEKIDPHERDVSFGDWLARSRFDTETKELALAFVEGFNASDARVIGAHALLRGEYASENSEGDKQSRLRNGYGALVEALRQTAVDRGVRIETGARVEVVWWRRGRVEVACEKGKIFEGEAAIVTLPLGVLKSGRVGFEPSLVHKQDAIEGLQFGNVAKLTFIFRRAWWEELKLERDFGFVHSFAEAIPTWWSDPRGPVLVGWAAGPKGERMLDLSEAELKQKALETMARVFARERQKIESDLLGVHFNNWRGDADIGGAYSYIPVNGLDLPKALAAPVEGTLFFAGEATASDAQMGTVSGAIESGFRVVEEIANG
jgi:monoamine oxidase